MSTEELKPCPMCGSADVEFASPGSEGEHSCDFVICNGCGISAGRADCDGDLIEVWNCRAAQSNSSSNFSSNCVGCEGSPSGDNNPCAVCGRAAPASGTEKDAERLDYMITEECQIEHMDRPGAPPLYRVRWPWREEHQSEWSKSGREAIDAAIVRKP